MSIWGPGIADNDDAADWLDEFMDEPSIMALHDAFDEVLSGENSDYVEVTEGAAAVAAAQIVTELFSKGGAKRLIEDEDVLLGGKGSVKQLHPGSRLHLVERAMRALSTVVYGAATSELHELVHEDAKLAKTWMKSMQGLEVRLLQVKEKLTSS